MNLKVRFIHETQGEHRRTICRILDLAQEIVDGDGDIKHPVLAEAQAIVSDKDNYDRRVGRKLSLLRAVKQLTEDVRASILTEWFATHPKDAAVKV